MKMEEIIMSFLEEVHFLLHLKGMLELSRTSDFKAQPLTNTNTMAWEHAGNANGWVPHQTY